MYLRRRCNFNPRAPCGARLHSGYRYAFQVGISIRAPRAGRDPSASGLLRPPANFNPRAPCGARRVCGRTVDSCTKFQSARPVRGATLPVLPLVSPV